MPRKPPDFEGFVGQPWAVRLLKRQVSGAKARGESFPPTLFSGPSGAGKTKLAEALASAMGTNIICVNGHSSPADLAEAFGQAETGDVVFIDESHGLAVKSQEMLFEVIDRCRLPGTGEQHGGQQAQGPTFKPISSCTVVLATDQPGKLLNALLKRMALHITLSYYPLSAMREICDRVATDHKVLISPQARNRIAKLCGGLPRNANHLLENLRRHFGDDAEQRQLTRQDVRRFMADLRIDRHGLGHLEQRYLLLLAEEKQLSIDSLSTQLGCDVDYLRLQVEPALRRLRLITIASGGRTLTQRGQELAAKYAASKSRKEKHGHDSGGQAAD